MNSFFQSINDRVLCGPWTSSRRRRRQPSVDTQAAQVLEDRQLLSGGAMRVNQDSTDTSAGSLKEKHGGGGGGEQTLTNSPSVTLDRGTLKITGTSAGDRIKVSYADQQSRDRVEVEIRRLDLSFVHYSQYNAAQIGLAEIFAGDGNDVVVYSLDVQSEIHGENGEDTLYGSNTAVDYLYGGADNDFLSGRGRGDYLYGGSFHDKIFGGDGRDHIWGEGGHDTIQGGDGDDVIRGGQLNDIIEGNDGEDVIYGDTGQDKLYGGNLYEMPVENGEEIDASYGALEPSHGDTDYLYGGDQDDWLYGMGGNDVLVGGNGNDYLRGGFGEDFLFGEGGNDTLFGDYFHTFLFGQGENDALYGGDGDDKLNGMGGNDELFGNTGADSLYGGSGDDLLDGGNDGTGDLLNGGFGQDEFIQYQRYYTNPYYWWTSFGRWLDEESIVDLNAGGETDVLTIIRN